MSLQTVPVTQSNTQTWKPSPKIIKEKIHSENIIFISEASFNPLFGFNGGPITLAKIINDQLISEAFYNQELSLPNPGNNKIGHIIEKKYQEYNNITSIELIAENNDNIIEIEIGKLNNTHNLMKNILNNKNCFLSDNKMNNFYQIIKYLYLRFWDH